MKILKLCLSFFLFTFCYTNSLWATHNRAGEIVIDQIGPLTIRATIITYTKASSTGADRAELPLVWGDGKLDTVRRSNGGGQGEIILGDDLKLNIYTATHTYLGRGRYTVSMTDPNRNAGILNVNFPNSVDIPFYLQTTFTFLSATSQGFNSTPRLLQPPIDKGCTNKRFIHSFNAFDPDGDSVAYRLITPLQAPNRVVPGYTFPDKIRASANNRIRLDERSGEFIWETPQEAGEYNVAFHIISYRNGSAIDTTIRDMQILIENCDNNPPKITTIDKICVIAGQEVKFAVTGTDPDAGQLVALSALGGPFVVSQSPAVFRSTRFDFKRPPVTDTFRWRTVCEHIENYPYTVTFKAEDNFRRAANDSIKLVDLKTVQIKVVGPPPQNVQANSISGAAIVSWAKPYACENAANRYFYAFQVWRREGNNPFQLDTCSPGLAGRGYTRVAFDTLFSLDVNGRYSYTDRTVERGKTYCYRIVGVFARRTPANVPFNLVESLASAEVCVQLQRDVPLITHATVDQTDPSVGRITVRWTKPNVNDLDTIQNPGPYRFVLERATGITRNNFQPIAGASFSSATFKGLNDTTWIDNNLNTVQNPYSYRVAFYIRRDSLLGYSQIASSHYLNIRSSDKLNELRVDKSVPWTNFKYDIFRSTNGINGVYDSIGTTTTEVYLDTNVVNKREYCYYVRAWGSYSFTGVPDSLINFSQRRCGTPIDTVPPCAPVLAVNNNCDSTGTVLEQNIINRLSWNLVTRCPGSKDAILYRIYYANTEGGNFQLIATINNILDTVYTHREAGSVAGCYYVTAVDSIGNESRRSNVICIDNCPVYKLPNAFTPNGDKQNDIFTPINSRYISKVEFKVVNRWGGLVFETTDPQLNWDGKNLSGNELAEGTYFYTCKVFEQRLSGEVMGTQILSGYIELFRGGN